MSAGLVASTETPGSTPPDASRAVPAMPLACCASAVPDRTIAKSDTLIVNDANIRRMGLLWICEFTNLRICRLFALCVRGAGRAQHVLQSEVSFVARVFVDETVNAIPRHLHRPRPRPRLRIGNGELIVDRPVARARKPFDQTHILRRVLERRTARFVGEIRRFDDERVAFPATARVAKPLADR